MKTLIGFISVIFLFMGSSPIKWAPESKAMVASLQNLRLVRPVLDLEEFPSGKPLQSSYEEAFAVSEIKACLSESLRGKVVLDDSEEIAYALPDDIQKDIALSFDEMRLCQDLSTVRIPDSLAADMDAGACYLLVYYQGYKRTRDSMTRGYHSASFQTEAVAKAYARDIDHFNSNKRSVFKALPKRFRATLMIALVRGDGAPIYFALAQNNDNPAIGATIRKLIGNCVKAIREIKAAPDRVSGAS